ncbi:MAG: IS110 family transposase [Actinomycetota bacterium]|nr:IS110 family transposase [Actinomycetota bacterium]
MPRSRAWPRGVHKDTISVAVLEPGADTPTGDKIWHDEPSVRRLLEGLADRARLWVCYEAGPTGYELQRLAASMGVRCEVIAPSLIPTAPGDRVKTDKRDCRRLARLYRAGQLTAIRVPSPAEEAVRDLCRARADLVDDRDRACKRLGGFCCATGGCTAGAATGPASTSSGWPQRFDERAISATLGHYRAVLAARDASVAAVDADLAPWFDREPFADGVHRLGAYRGIAHLGALTLASEVCDWRRFPRAGAFMGCTGLVPWEYSSGGSVRRGHLTKAGNAHLRTQLVESAWGYQHRPAVGVALRHRQDGLDPQVVARAWEAQLRLCGRFRRLAQHKNVKSVVVAAIARELAGFVWAETTVSP